MADWQVTATTIYCDAVDDEVTIIVQRDFSSKCTGYKKYANPDKSALALLKKKGGNPRRELRCAGMDCAPVRQYLKKLLAEEKQKGAPAG